LERNNLGQNGIDFALSYLKSNPILKRFAVWHNQINDMADINKLCEIVQSHPSIEILELPGTKGTDVNGYKMLEMIMNAGRSNLDSIDLSNNNISTGGGTYISDFLTTNPILGSLFLDGNSLNDRDALVIAKALKYNTNLGFLDLTGNNGISKRGWLALRKAEFDDTSLNAIADCNHTCNIRYPSLMMEHCSVLLLPLGLGHNRSVVYPSVVQMPFLRPVSSHLNPLHILHKIMGWLGQDRSLYLHPIDGPLEHLQDFHTLDNQGNQVQLR